MTPSERTIRLWCELRTVSGQLNYCPTNRELLAREEVLSAALKESEKADRSKSA